MRKHSFLDGSLEIQERLNKTVPYVFLQRMNMEIFWSLQLVLNESCLVFREGGW